MPYKSDAQRRFFHAAEQRGEIKKSAVNEFDQASKGKKLPEHVKNLYEGGLIEQDEYDQFQASYHHDDSELPSPGYDEDATEEVGDEYEPEAEDATSRQFASALRKQKRGY